MAYCIRNSHKMLLRELLLIEFVECVSVEQFQVQSV